ncbi:helix-turn-helix domain-containing protein [Pontiella sulfatireligans]|nr:helix-turn-helix domain-containing protein [Pontiella sulfatireligans]
MMKITNMPPRALKAGEAATYLGISRRYLHDLCADGRIPYSKIGRRCHVFEIEELNRFLEEHKIKAAI